MSTERGPKYVGGTDLIWTDEDGQPWRIQVELALIGGRAEVVALTIASAEAPGVRRADRPYKRPGFVADGPAVVSVPTSGVVRSVRPGEALAPVANDEAHLSSAVVRAVPFGALSAAARSLFAMSNPNARAAIDASRERDGSSYAEVAEVYNAAHAAGENPRAAVAAHFTISPGAAAKRISRARKKGLLPLTERGVARGNVQQIAGTVRGKSSITASGQVIKNKRKG